MYFSVILILRKKNKGKEIKNKEKSCAVTLTVKFSTQQDKNTNTPNAFRFFLIPLNGKKKKSTWVLFWLTVFLNGSEEHISTAAC